MVRVLFGVCFSKKILKFQKVKKIVVFFSFHFVACVVLVDCWVVFLFTRESGHFLLVQT